MQHKFEVYNLNALFRKNIFGTLWLYCWSYEYSYFYLRYTLGEKQWQYQVQTFGAVEEEAYKIMVEDKFFGHTFKICQNLPNAYEHSIFIEP